MPRSPELGILFNDSRGQSQERMVSDLGCWKPCHNVVGWPAPVIKKSEGHLVEEVNVSCFRCLKISQISYDLCQSLFPPVGGNVVPPTTPSVAPGGAVLVLPGACRNADFWAPSQNLTRSPIFICPLKFGSNPLDFTLYQMISIKFSTLSSWQISKKIFSLLSVSLGFGFSMNKYIAMGGIWHMI